MKRNDKVKQIFVAAIKAMMINYHPTHKNFNITH